MLVDASNLVQRLELGARRAITSALARGAPGLGAPYDEVSAVKAVVLHGMARLAAAWRVRLAPLYTIDVTPVFIHGFPRVHSHAVRGTGTCELSDILFVIDECAPYGAILDRRAVLVQAKIASGSHITLTGESEWKQHDLMSHWPLFTFKDRNRYDGRQRNFHQSTAPGDAEFSGEYAAIDLAARPPKWTQLLIGRGGAFHGDIDLAAFLAQMTVGNSETGRKAVPSGDDDWSFTVDELLQVTAGIQMKSGKYRGTTYPIAFIANPPVGSGTAPPPREATTAPDDGGISVVRIAIVRQFGD